MAFLFGGSAAPPTAKGKPGPPGSSQAASSKFLLLVCKALRPLPARQPPAPWRGKSLALYRARRTGCGGEGGWSGGQARAARTCQRRRGGRWRGGGTHRSRHRASVCTEQMRAANRGVTKATRTLDRDLRKLEMEEKKILMDVKKLAAAGQKVRAAKRPSRLRQSLAAGGVAWGVAAPRRPCPACASHLRPAGVGGVWPPPPARLLSRGQVLCDCRALLRPPPGRPCSLARRPSASWQGPAKMRAKQVVQLRKQREKLYKAKTSMSSIKNQQTAMMANQSVMQGMAAATRAMATMNAQMNPQQVRSARTCVPLS